MTTSHERHAAQVAAVKELQEADHRFLSQEGVNKLTAPFGFVGSTFVAKNTIQNDPKGLLLDGDLQEAAGQDASVTAKEICRYVGVEFVQQMGRGSQLRMCCKALLDALERNPGIPLLGIKGLSNFMAAVQVLGEKEELAKRLQPGGDLEKRMRAAGFRPRKKSK